MNTRLVQVQQRVAGLEQLADEVAALADRACKQDDVVNELTVKGQAWYRGAREVLVQQKSSALGEIEQCYQANTLLGIDAFFSAVASTPYERERCYSGFRNKFRKARALVLSVVEELQSRELPVLTQLSFSVAADEFDKAQLLLDESKGDMGLLRASGVVARVALERHLFTVAEARGLTVLLNPPTKKKADVEDVLNTLVKADAITAVQRAQLAALFSVANNCAHPKEAVRSDDVRRLITDGRTAATTIL
jgi:hypothetical protein